MGKKIILVVIPKNELKKTARRQKRVIELTDEDFIESVTDGIRGNGDKIIASHTIDPADPKANGRGGEMEFLSSLSGLSGCDFFKTFDYLLNLGYNLAKSARQPRLPKKKAVASKAAKRKRPRRT